MTRAEEAFWDRAYADDWEVFLEAHGIVIAEKSSEETKKARRRRRETIQSLSFTNARGEIALAVTREVSKTWEAVVPSRDEAAQMLAAVNAALREAGEQEFKDLDEMTRLYQSMSLLEEARLRALS